MERKRKIYLLNYFGNPIILKPYSPFKVWQSNDQMRLRETLYDTFSLLLHTIVMEPLEIVSTRPLSIG